MYNGPCLRRLITSYDYLSDDFALKNAKTKHLSLLPCLNSAIGEFVFAGLCRATLVEIEFYAR